MSAPAMDTPLIALRGLSRIYDAGESSIAALDHIDLAIHAGEFVAIMGPSGSGKSTLMNILGCLDRPTHGAFLVDGVDVAALSAGAVAALRRETFGFVFQRYHLMPGLTAQDNVAMPAVYGGSPRIERVARSRALLERLRLGDRLDHRPGQLSGGQQQRVSIARALMNGARVILADEPTGALDSASGREVLDVLHALHRAGHTIILITHDRDVAGHADRIVELADGKVVRDEAVRKNRAAVGAALTRNSGGGMGGTGTVMIESFRMALRALVHNPLRTSLTMLGIVIGVGSVIAMLAIGAGVKQQVLDRIQAMGTDLLSVKRGLAGVRGSGSGVITLTVEDLAPINSVPGVLVAVPETDRTVLIRQGSQDLIVPAVGTGERFPSVRSWPVRSGTFFSAEDVQRYTQVVVLGAAVVDELFPRGTSPIGKFVILNNSPFMVVGTMAAKGTSRGGTDLDYQVWVPHTTASTRLFGQRHFRDVTVKVKDDASMATVERAIRLLLIDRHGKEDFHIRSMADVIDTANQTQNTLTYLLLSIAVISLVVGGIGVMNIMLVSVTERTREIGIRMAVGARGSDVLAQFLIEAVTVCLVGGVIGIALGIAGADAAGRMTGWPTIFSVTPVVLAFSCALVTGIVFGFLPAKKAADLDPVDALVRE